jgi:hypothetical protein
MTALASVYPLITAAALLESFCGKSQELCPRPRYYITTWLKNDSKWFVTRDEASQLPLLDQDNAALWTDKFEAIKYLFKLRYADYNLGTGLFHRSCVQRVAYPHYN